jgi:hypothetical protein
MFDFSAFRSDPIRIEIVFAGDLAIMVGPKAVPLGAIERVEFDGMDPVDCFAGPYCRNSVSSRYDADKHI